MNRHRRTSVVSSSVMFAAIAVSGCGGDSAGPGEPRDVRLVITPVFDVAGGAAAAGIVEIAQTRIRILGTDEAVVIDTLVTVPEGADSVTLVVNVQVASPGETFSMTIDFITPTGEIAFQGGPVQVTPSAPGSDAAPIPVEVVATYVGVGSNAASVRITTPGAILPFGASVTLVAEALDAQGEPIVGTPIATS